MSRQIQIRRGSAAENDAFTGAIGEVTMDTTNKTLRVHDGTTAGGTTLAKQSEIPDLTNVDYVVVSQLPTAENNYTWYRKYKSGWVEQGGIKTNTTSQNTTISLPITMADTNYTTLATGIFDDNGTNVMFKTKGTTTLQITTENSAGVDTARYFDWMVIGIAAE